MTSQELQTVLQLADARLEGEWYKLADDKTLTLHVAKNGVGLTVSKVVELQLGETLIQARSAKGDLHVVALVDVFASTVDSVGGRTRKAGFV